MRLPALCFILSTITQLPALMLDVSDFAKCFAICLVAFNMSALVVLATWKIAGTIHDDEQK